MCIRDSVWAVEKGDNVPTTALVGATDTASSLKNVKELNVTNGNEYAIPVSYTHLL